MVIMSEQQIKTLKARVEKLSKEREYFRKRMFAAEDYIRQSPCDPDIYPEQLEAYSVWQEIVKQENGI